jgi:predicted nucleic acid-binding protein
MSRRVVLDTSTLVSAALQVGSVPNQVLLEALASWEVCASVDTLAELERVLEKKKLIAIWTWRHGWSLLH